MGKINQRKKSSIGKKPITMKTMTSISAVGKINNIKEKNKRKKNLNFNKNENPFDRFANSRQKHEVLNRKVKGEDRDVGRSRSIAIDLRKKKLLKDYHLGKNSNEIIDHRFGEDDPMISLEEKMFLRFQHEKTKKLRRNTSIGFNLRDHNDEEEFLTHKGKILGESNLNDRDWHSEDEDEGGLSKEIVNNLHFGGGLQLKRPAQQQVSKDTINEENDQQVIKRGRLDALQEIVMKSKLYKMQRKEAKEEQEEETMKLDEEYDTLLQSAMLNFAAPGENKRRARTRDASAGADDYDLALREMAYEARVQATDRTKTQEELAIEQQEKIEQLEAARLKRMQRVENIGDDEDNDVADAVLGTDGHGVARRDRFGNTINAKENVPSGSIVLNGKVLSTGGSLTTKRQRTDDEIDDFYDFAPSAVVTSKQKPFEGGIHQPFDEDEDEDADADLEGEDKEEDESDDESEEDEDDDDESIIEEEDIKLAHAADDDNSQFDNDDQEEEEDQSDAEEGMKLDENGVNLEMPHKIDCPVNIDNFDELCEQYVKNRLTDFMALIDRILAWNSVHLPGARGAENRNHMHNFLDILLKCFIREGDELMVGNHKKDNHLQKLDYLSGVIFQISQDLGEGPSTSLWLRTLKIIRSQVEKRMRDYGLGIRSHSCWPSLGRLFLLRLAGKVFSVTDLKNDVTQFAAIQLCQCLAQCPVVGVPDIASGLMSCAILLSYAHETKRLYPEVIAFITRCISLYLPHGSGMMNKQLQTNMLNTFQVINLDWLRSAAAATKTSKESDTQMKLPWRAFATVSHSKATLSVSRRGQEYARGIIVSIYALVDTLLVQQADNTALPELFESIIDMLMTMRPHDEPKMERAILQSHAHLLEKLRIQSIELKSSRLPLQWRKKQAQAIETKAPRFQLDYTFKKDQDTDQDRAKFKQLSRQLKREKKAAMRELRRDSDFLAAERQRELDDAERARKNQRHRNYAWMESQQATINQQVKQGKGLMKGGGSGVTKTGRTKRLK